MGPASTDEQPLTPPASRAARVRRRAAAPSYATRLAPGLALALALAAVPADAGPQSPSAGAHAAAKSRAWPGADTVWLMGDYVDYAPAGMPDFSQCRREWSQPGSPGQWTYAGPVALANVLWWLDSAAEPNPGPPPAVQDGHPLVTAYPVFGRAIDDHAPENLPALVDDLALRAGTDGLGQPRAERGTRWESLVEATRDYVRGRRLSSHYAVVTTERPDTTWLAQRIAETAGVVLLLGVWESQENGWRRVGGHFVALAGSDSTAGTVAVADPLVDAAGIGGPGRSMPMDPRLHSCRTAPRAHDSPAVISHDAYALEPQPALPGNRSVLTGYFSAASYHEAAAFVGQNAALSLQGMAGAWRGGEVVMALDAALALVPDGFSRPSPTPSPTVSPTATASPSPTATHTATPDASPTRPPLTVATDLPARVTHPRLVLPIALRRR